MPPSLMVAGVALPPGLGIVGTVGIPHGSQFIIIAMGVVPNCISE